MRQRTPEVALGAPRAVADADGDATLPSRMVGSVPAASVRLVCGPRLARVLQVAIRPSSETAQPGLHPRFAGLHPVRRPDRSSSPGGFRGFAACTHSRVARLGGFKIQPTTPSDPATTTTGAVTDAGSPAPPMGSGAAMPRVRATVCAARRQPGR